VESGHIQYVPYVLGLNAIDLTIYKKLLGECDRLPEKYKENFHVSSKGPSSGSPDKGPTILVTECALSYIFIFIS
jgi:hypothetical protein